MVRFHELKCEKIECMDTKPWGEGMFRVWMYKIWRTCFFTQNVEGVAFATETLGGAQHIVGCVKLKFSLLMALQNFNKCLRVHVWVPLLNLIVSPQTIPKTAKSQMLNENDSCDKKISLYCGQHLPIPISEVRFDVDKPCRVLTPKAMSARHKLFFYTACTKITMRIK